MGNEGVSNSQVIVPSTIQLAGKSGRGASNGNDANNRTLFARMTGMGATAMAKKANETGGSGGPENATQRTAPSLNETSKTGAAMGSTMGMTSPFKDAMHKGVVSGIGMLTF